ncbi:S-layer homology domain-containing protein [Pseudoflavonifractor sp. AF19-9AC]|uniref:S-layer homology domain-containing protein n=1 Tax=Pseudoflavonifractor sp. AF19-9AC TaxID=2292244 RepID=UPI0013147725|nr:S-layer homology domain-containing protein [Pseudoflavonifractor sp. AF19-9AC]
MRNLKRALSLALASVMLLGMMVVGTGASYADVESTDNVEAIEVMQAIGVMVGDTNGNFNPDQKVTRGEMAVVMTNLLGLNVNDYAGSTLTFTDVPDWGKGFVAACLANGIAAGYNDKQFGFNDSVTTAQAALMVMKALGYFQYTSDFGGDWQLATVKQGSKIDLFKGIETGASAAMTRNDVAQIALTALKATVVEAEDDGIGLDANGNLVSKYKYVDYTTNSNGTSDTNDAISNQTDSNGKDLVQLGEQLYKGKLKLQGITPVVDDMRRPAHTWEYKGDKVGTYADDADHTFAIDSTTGTKASMSTWLKEIKDNYTIPSMSTGSSVVYVNGVQDTSYAPAIGDQVEVFENATTATTIDKIIVTQYKLAKIDKVDTNVSSTDAKNDVTAYITLKNAAGTTIGTFKDTDIAGYAASTYVKGAYIAAAINGTKVLDSYVVTPAAQGQVTAYKTNDSYTIGGNKYTAVTTGQFVEDYTEGDYTGTYAAYTDKNGLLIGIVEIEASSVATDAVYLSKMWADDSTSSSYGENTLTYKAQVVDMTGAVKTITIGYTTTKGEIKGLDAAGYGYTKATIAGDGDLETTHFYVDKTGAMKAVSSQDTYPTGDTLYGNSATTTPFYTKNASASAAIGSLYTLKENSDKYTELTAYTNATDNTYDIGSVSTVTSIKSDDTKLGSYYVNADTKYIVIEGSGSNIEVTVKTGGLSYAGSAATATVIYTKSGSANVASYVILPVASYSAGASEDVLYVKSYDGVVDGGYAYTVYTEDGKTMSIVADKAPYATPGNTSGVVIKGAFYKYTVNSKNVYTLSAATAISIGSNVGVWDGKITAQTGVDIGSTFVSVYGNLLTIDNVTSSDYKLGDIDASKAVVIDLHETDNDEYTNGGANPGKETYSGTITGLDGMDAAADAGYAITLDLSIKEDGATIIFVKDVYRSTVDTIASAAAVKVTDPGSDLNVTSAATVTNGTTNTIVVKVNPTGADNGDSVKVTFTKGQADQTLSKADVTLTKNNGTWSTDTVTVVAANGSTRTYTVSVNEAV